MKKSDETTTTTKKTAKKEKVEVVKPISTNKEKSEKSKGILLGISITLVIVGIALVCLAALITFKGGDILNNFASKKEDSTKLELQYTETTNPKNEGVYMIDVSDIVENVMPSIVAITSKTLVNSGMYGPSFFGNQETYATGAGSGIIVQKTETDLLILTNNHVVEDTSSLSVQFIDGTSVDATIKGSSATRDLAIISIPLKNIAKETGEKIKIATIGDSNELKVGNGVIAIGNALGYGQSVTTGVVSALNRSVSIDSMKNNMIQIDAAINGGNSGGALLNSKGEVVGINSAKYSSGGSSTTASIEGMGFAIPISDVKKLIEQLMNGEVLSEDQKGYLGVSGYMNDAETAKESKLPVGFYVTEVVKGSGADKAGIQQYDIITKIGDKDVTDFNVISDYLADKKAGDKVKLTITYQSRSGNYKTEEVTVTLSDYKDIN